MTKLRIDMFSGTLEVDGEEAFVRSVYDDFKYQLLALGTSKTVAPDGAVAAASVVQTPVSQDPAPAAGPATSPEVVAEPQPYKKPVARKRPAGSLTLLKDLDLSDASNDFSLLDFYAAKVPQTAMESNVIFVYFLKQIVQTERVTVDHIYTCYKYVNVKYPNALRQSLADTSSRKNWLDTSSFDDIRLSTAGENFVEHDLPRGTGL